MLFSSLLFLFLFLPLVLGVYYLLPKRFRNAFLFLANLVFYGFGEPIFILLMLFSVAVNWAGGLWIARCRAASRQRRLAVTVTVAVNLLILGVFKYAGLISDTLRLIPPLAGLPVVEIPLPIGISFYTFQAMSYVIDVARGDCKPQRSVLRFGTYISLFPQLIAGPIVRYKDVAQQLEDPNRESAGMFNRGVEIFLVGLGKKVLLANTMGSLWVVLSADPAASGLLGAWLGILVFGLQIYFDFSGYSDMARGLGQMFGFTFCENFNYPFIAQSVAEFWRRWHMSLTTWFRDYVYIPLGGNRKGFARTLLNIALVWTLTGLWHGASWNFLLWGVYYGIVLILERLFLGKLLDRLPRVLRHVYTIVMVSLGWTLFAIDRLSDSLKYLSALVTPGGMAPTVRTQVLAYLPMFLAACLACLPAGRSLYLKLPERPRRLVTGVLGLLALVLCTGALVSDSYNPFLYFRF